MWVNSLWCSGTRKRLSLVSIVLCCLVVVVSVPWGFAARVGREGLGGVSYFHVSAGSRWLVVVVDSVSWGLRQAREGWGLISCVGRLTRPWGSLLFRSLGTGGVSGRRFCPCGVWVGFCVFGVYFWAKSESVFRSLFFTVNLGFFGAFFYGIHNSEFFGFFGGTNKM